MVEINDIVVQLSRALNRVEGRDNEEPKYYNDVDFNRMRAKNMSDPLSDSEPVTLGYLRRWIALNFDKNETDLEGA